MTVHAAIYPEFQADETVDNIAQTIRALNATECGGELWHKIADHLHDLEADATCEMATTPQMAILQIGLMKGLADLIENGTSDDKEEYQMAIGRMANGLIRFIEVSFGVVRQDYELDYFSSDHTDKANWGMGDQDLTRLCIEQVWAVSRLPWRH